MDAMEDPKRMSRRRHADELKRQVLAACAEPGVSVAQVALAHGLNANLVHKWCRAVDTEGVDAKRHDPQAEFVSLTLAPGLTVASDIHLELRRGAITVNVTWPLSASNQLAATSPTGREKQQPKRQVLPVHLPRREIRHEPQSTTCTCGCAKCETLVQTPVAPHVIDKGIPTAGLLSQVLVHKYLDHLLLYRQEAIFGRAGLAIPRSTLANWAGQCGVQLQPLVDALKREMLEGPACGGVRLRRQPRRSACSRLPRVTGRTWLARHAGVR